MTGPPGTSVPTFSEGIWQPVLGYSKGKCHSHGLFSGSTLLCEGVNIRNFCSLTV